jgi:vacuolar protein sorting-associated protein 13A/C
LYYSFDKFFFSVSPLFHVLVALALRVFSLYLPVSILFFPFSLQGFFCTSRCHKQQQQQPQERKSHTHTHTDARKKLKANRFFFLKEILFCLFYPDICADCKSVKMLEKYIAALLVPYLSKYIENINEDQLKINIWSGKAALNDLVLRPEALDALLSSIDDGEGDADAATAGASPVSELAQSKKKKPTLPVRAHRGICKSVSLSIPIKHLRSEPVVMEVGELLLTLKGVSDLGSAGSDGGAVGGEDGGLSSSSSSGLRNVKAERWNAIAEAKAKELHVFEEERKRQRGQIEQQAAAAAAAAKDTDAAGNQKSGGSFFSRLGELVINNVIVKVQTVHIRYEDVATDTVIGAVLGGVQLLTMNEATGQPMFTDPSGLQKMWKRLVFSDLQVYCDDPSRVRANAPLGRSWYSKIDDWQQWYHRMRQRARDGAVALSTILGPVSGGLDAKVVFKMFARELLSTPYADVSLKLQHVMATLTRAQYTTLLQAIMLLTNQAEASELQRMRPRVPVKGHARVWWRYAIRAVRCVLEEPKRVALLARVSAACRLDYQVLYRDVVRQTEMTPEKKKTYRFITRFMTTEDMKAGRRYVYAQIAKEIEMKRKDNEIRKAEEMAKQHQASVQQQQQRQGREEKAHGQSKRGWFSWLVGSSDAASPNNSIANSATAKEIEEDEQFFKTVEQEYGISTTDAEAYQSTAAAFKPEAESGLPPSYCWLRATFELPFMSYCIDTEQGDFVTLKIFHLRGGVTSFNKPGSLLFYFRTQNITLANPAASFSSPSPSAAKLMIGGGSSASPPSQGCGVLVPYLIEGVQVHRRASKSSPTGERVTIHSLTAVDCGKHIPSAAEAPTIHDVIDVAGGRSESPSPPPPVPSSRPQASATAKGSSGSSSSASGEDDKLSSSELLTAADYATPLFSITGFLNPVEQPLADTTVDVAVKVQLLPLRIVADPTTIEHLIRFFTPPVGLDVSSFAESTKHVASAVGSAASQELRVAMAKAKGLYITVDASAPVLILPKSLNAGAQETALSVSLGRVRFHARPLSEAEKQRRLTAAATVTDKPPLPTPTKPSLSDGESCVTPTTAATAQESLFYYPHKASFSKFYLELTTVEKAMRRPQRGFLLIPEVSIAADVLQRIDDRNTSREALVLRLKVPSLRVACSLHQVYLITSLAEAWTAHMLSNKQKEGLAQGELGGAGKRSPSGGGALSRPPSRTPPVSESMELHAESSGAGKWNAKSVDGDASPSPGSSPAPSAVSSPASNILAKTAAGGGDPPVMRVELLVQRLGLDVHDDDAETLLVSPLPTYRIECASAELIFAVRTHHKKMVLWLKEPHAVAARDVDRPILSCGGVRADVLILEGETPTGVAVSLDGSLNLCVGTACVEMLETTMDVVNLILSALDNNDNNGLTALADAIGTESSLFTAAGGKVDVLGNTSGNDVPAAMARLDPSVAGPTSRISDLAYQINMVRQQCAMPNRHVADVFVRVRGPATVTLLNRAPGETVDRAFASAAVNDVEMRLSKFAVTMDLSGRVGAVSATVLETSGLVEENRALLTYTPALSCQQASSSSENDGGSSSSSSGGSNSKVARVTPPSIQVPSHASSSLALDADSEQREAVGKSHISFSFRKSRPVMPLFREVDGKRVLANPQELRYSSALELLIGSSAVTIDLNTIMVFKTYLLSGLFSRISRLSDRPLYNGRTPPPAREGPRLLMSFRIVVRDTVVVLPVDPRQHNTQRFCASLGSLVVESSLHTAECKETTNVSFSELGMWREAAVGAKGSSSGSSKRGVNQKLYEAAALHTALLPKQIYLEVAIRFPLDLLSDDAPHIDIRSKDVSLELQEADLVQLVTLLRQNLMRTDPADIARYTVEVAKPVRQVVVGQDGRARLVVQSTSQKGADNNNNNSAPESTAVAVSTSFAVPAIACGSRRRNEEMFVSLRVGRVSMLLADEDTAASNNPITSTGSRFQLHSSELATTAALPSNHIGVQWKSLELDDVRDNNSSALVICEEGSLEFTDSLTTRHILMRNLGVRRNALRSVDPEEWRMGSVTSNSSSSSDTEKGGARLYAENKDDDGEKAELFSLPDIEAERNASRSSSGVARTDTQLLTISVMSADFTLRRLSVSDQWLALYDTVCNESVVSAWTAPQTGLSAVNAAARSERADATATADADAAAAPAKSTGMRIFVTTPSVVVPFLNSRRETLIEADIAALLVDVVRLPNASTQVAVKVRELDVVDAVSNEKLIFRRTPSTATTMTATATNRSASSPAGSPAPAGDVGGAATSAAGGRSDSKSPKGAAPAITSVAKSDWAEGWDDVDASFSPLLCPVTGGSTGGGLRDRSGGRVSSHCDNGGASATSSPAGAKVPSAGAATTTGGSDGAGEAEVLQFIFKSDPETNTNKIQLGIGALHALVSMPVINGLVDYFTSPLEPVAKIGSLGVMREQRARMAAVAQQMANSSHLVLHVLWRQPRIILAADGLRLNQRRWPNLEMRLGVMRAAVHLKSSAATLSVVVKVQEYNIPSLLKRSALRFSYQSIRGVDTIELNMQCTTAQFYPTEVERLILLGHRNILLPRGTHYYGKYEKAGSPPMSTAAAAASSASSPPPPPPSSGSASPTKIAAVGGVSSQQLRTVQVHIDGLRVAIHDAVGLNTHILSLTSLDLFVAADGSVEVLVPSFNLIDQSTGRCLVQSSTKTASRIASPNAGVVPPMAPHAPSSDSASNAAAAADGASPDKRSAEPSTTTTHAVRVYFDSKERVANTHIGSTLVTAIPRSIGSLANSFLSVRIPSLPPAMPTATTMTGPPLTTAGLRSSSTVSTGTPLPPPSTVTTISTTATPPTAATGIASAEESAKPFTMRTTLSECKVRFCQGEREVAVLRLFGIACNSVAHPDGTGELSVTLDNLFMVDSVSVATNFRTFIYPYHDDETEEERRRSSGAGNDVSKSTVASASDSDPAAATAAPSPVNAAGEVSISNAPAVTAVEYRENLSSSAVHVPVVPCEGVVTYEVRSLPPTAKSREARNVNSGTAAASCTPAYTKQMRCRVRSLCFIFVPDVVHAVLGVMHEVQMHVSEGNRDKAYHYVSDRAAETVKRKASDELTEVDIVVSRPQVLLVDKPTAATGVQLSPGSLSVKSRLVVPTAASVATAAPALSESTTTAGKTTIHKAEKDIALQVHEVFNVEVHKLGMLLQGVNCFQKDCNILVEYQRSLAVPMPSSAASDASPLSGSVVRSFSAKTTVESAVPVPSGPGAAVSAASSADASPTPPPAPGATATAGSTKSSIANTVEAAIQNSLLKVHIAVLSMNFTQRQTDFAMDVLGAVLRGSAADRTVRTVATMTTNGGGGASSSAAAGSRSSRSVSMAAVGAANSSDYGAGWARKEQQHLYDPNAAVPPTAFGIDAHIGVLQADLADLFRLHVDDVHVRSSDVSTTGKTIETHIGSMFIQHVGAEVDAENSGEAPGAVPASTSVSGTAASIAHPGGSSTARKMARIQELVDLLVLTKLHVQYVQPQSSIDVDTASSITESTVNVSAGVFNIAVSPTILFDTRELLYLPFCYKVLRVPIDPIPVLNLMGETTTLEDDIVLDEKHVLLTASRTRCNYVLDLNQHKLVLTGAPSGQIVLCEGCELTITNGTICIPGMYTIGSYVSFAPSTALFTSESCKFEKQFLNVANSAFFDSIVGRPAFAPPVPGRAAAVASGNNNNDSAQSPLNTARCTDTPASSPSASIDPLNATAALHTNQQSTPTATAAADSVIELRDRTVRVMANFFCHDMQLQMLSEEVVDLSVSLHMHTRLRFVQDWENEQPARRTVSMQMTNLRSGEDEEHILLPTEMVMNVSGVDNVSVSLILDSMEFCTRTTLLRSLVELGKDFGAAFIEETTVARVKPRVEYETQSLDALYPVLEAGECQHCGRDIAYLALASDKPGILCYKCCTGYESLPAMDFRVEVPLVDGILFGSSGDMAHVYIRNVLLSVDPSMELQLTLRMSLYGFSNVAAVWEPVVEQFDATITGSVSTHDYRIRMDRLDYVLSPQNIRLLYGMVGDYGSATALQKQLRKRFRRQKQQRTQQVAPNQGVPMYVSAGLLEEVARVELQEEEMTLARSDNDNQEVSLFHPMGFTTSPTYPPLNSINAAALTNTSVFDILNSTNLRLLSGAMGLSGNDLDTDVPPAAEPPKRGYAHVYVKNHCNVPLMVEGRRVTPRGGTLRFIAKGSIVNLKRVVRSEDGGAEVQGGDYATSISNPPLYVQTQDMVLETKVLLSQEDGSRYLRRTITMTVYPLHMSRTIICIENRLHCPLASIGNYPPVKPGERFYLASRTDLNAEIVVQPVHTADRVEYEVGRIVGEALDDSPATISTDVSKLPSIYGVLSGVPIVLLCKAKNAEGKSMTVKVYARQEEMRGGLPTFVIVVEPRFRLRNKLPYRLILNVLPDPNGDLVRGRNPTRPVQPLVSTVLEVRQGADLILNTYKMDQVAFLLEVRQRRPPRVGENNVTKNSSSVLTASTSLAGALRGKPSEDEEVFSTLVPTAISEGNPYISLRSQFRRELLIHAVYVPSKGSVVFTTPFVLLNHSPLALTLRECTPDGANKLYDAEPNYSVLHPEMNASVAAAPMGIKDSENFFVNIYHEEYRGTCVPLHAQQRGVVILQDCGAAKAAKSKASSTSCSGGGSAKKRSDGTSTAAEAKIGPIVIHLAYSSEVDPCGSLLVRFAPRWIVVNRSHLPLYVAPSTYNGITAKEASAAATAAMMASQQKHGDGANAGAKPGASPPGLPAWQQKVDEMKNALQEMVAGKSIVFLSDAPTQVTPLPPYSATPFFETPLCSPEVGYNIHVLQSPLAPLYGTPVGIENIHSELIVAYKPIPDTHSSQSGSSSSAVGSSRQAMSSDRDRFLEVSLVVRDPYTYIVLEPPERVPYLLLNRTAYTIEARDTASKSKGRLMARVQPGCGTDLILDSTVTTLMQVLLFGSDGSKPVYEVVFDVGRAMTRCEMSAAMSSPAGVLYSLSWGGFGQQIIDVSPARAAMPPAYTSVAAPPIPINVLLNLGVTTLSVVMPNQDVLFCAITDIRFSWDRQKDREIMKFSMENFQVDNQTEVSPRYESCLLSLRTSTSFAAASGYVERVLLPAKGLICLEEVRLDFVPAALRVSDTLLVACAGFVQAVRSGEDAPADAASNQSMLAGSVSVVELQEAEAAPRERCPSATKLYTDAPVQIDIWASRLTLERFIINPIVVRVWLTRDVEEHDFFRENINSKDAALLSMMVPSCEDVTIAAPGIVTAKQASRLGVFVEWVGKTYQDGLLSQLKGLLLQYASSLPMIGAPLKLASGFGNGAVRLFRDPIDGLSTSPSAFAQGLARGSAGFAQEFVGGGLGAFSNVTDSWSRLLSMGSGVSEKERRKQNTLSGFASSFMGIIQRPMEGAAESGAAGFLKGTAQGLVGVVANPMSGFLSDVSRATGTLGKLVTDTYIPKTRRLRPIRDFHANGGIAPWRSLVSVYQYQRLKASTRVFSGDQLVSSVDGPEWYPSRREGATYGRNNIPIPAERWTLDRYHTNFEGWTYSTKYYGLYSERLTSKVRVRRMRWTALVRPLPYSRVAFYLQVAPGMETQRRGVASTVFSSFASLQETDVEFTSPGQLPAMTVEQAKARKRRFFALPGLHHSRRSSSNNSAGGTGSSGDDKALEGSGSPRRKLAHSASKYFAEEEYADQRKTLYQRMRNLTAAGRHVGVKTNALRSTSSVPGTEDNDLPVGAGTETTSVYSLEAGGAAGSSTAASFTGPAGASGRGDGVGGGIKVTRSTADLQAPDAPRNRQKGKNQRHSRSASELDATSGSSTPFLGPQSGTTSSQSGDKKANVSKQDKQKAEAIAAATQSPRGETLGSKLPHPGATRFVRSNSGKVEVSDAAASLAAVPGASPTFASRICGTSAGPLPTTIVEVYEYEKKVALIGWGKRYLPSECPGWQDSHGNEVPSRQEIRAPAGWAWTTEWTIIGGDSEGWTMMSGQKSLRRRLWQRRLVKLPPSQGQPT